MIKITVKSDTKLWDDLKQRLQQDTSELQIGFFEESRYGPENNNLQVALVAAWNELGHSGDVPPRPFMRVGLKGLLSSSLYTTKYKEAFIRTLIGKGNITSGYTAIQDSVVPDLKKIIDDWLEPPNSPSTIKRKDGRNDPLVDTGKMRDSVKAKISKTFKRKI